MIGLSKQFKIKTRPSLETKLVMLEHSFTKKHDFN